MTNPHWHPWRALRALPHVDIIFTPGPGSHTHWGDDGTITITIDSAALQSTRRSIAAHELVHVERGPAPACPVLTAREERAVDAEAARRLITIDRLANTLAWTRCIHEAADDLWVHPHTLSVRLATLTHHERVALYERTTHHD